MIGEGEKKTGEAGDSQGRRWRADEIEKVGEASRASAASLEVAREQVRESERVPA